jgi:hypothetical protein
MPVSPLEVEAPSSNEFESSDVFVGERSHFGHLLTADIQNKAILLFKNQENSIIVLEILNSSHTYSDVLRVRGKSRKTKQRRSVTVKGDAILL